MADRYPLIANRDTQKIEELAAFDNLNLTNSGIVSATTIQAQRFIGDLTGTATTAINLSNAANITTGIVSTARLAGSYDINISGVANTAVNLANAANIVTGTISPDRLTGPYNIDITGVAANSTRLQNAANIDAGVIDPARLTGVYNISITGDAANANARKIYVSDDQSNQINYIVSTPQNTGLTSATVDSTGLTYNPALNRLGVGKNNPTQAIDAVGNISVSGNYFGAGETLAGIVTQITAGIGINLSPTTGKGNVTVDAYRPNGKTIFVNQNGKDSNTGLAENDAKRTIKAAANVAVYGDTIKVYPGVYIEENPIVLKKKVSIQGTELRNCVVTPKYPYNDVFYVNNGCHITNLSFIGPDMTDGAAVVTLQRLQGVAVDRYFDAARMIRMNLDYIAKETVGFLTSGFSGFAGSHREQDAARLIDKNVNYIAAEAVGFLTAPTGYNFTLNNSDYTNCKEDIVSIMGAISYDLKANSNRKSVGAALSYFNSSGGLIHITGIATQQATIAALNYAAGIATHVINNLTPPISYQSGIGSIPQVIDPSVILVAGGCVGVGTTIRQLVGIITSAIGAASTNGLPSIRYGVTLETEKCSNDIKSVWKCIIHDITRGGNSRSVDAGKAYYDSNWNLIPQILHNPGEKDQTVASVDYSFNIARAIVNNSTWGGYPVGLGTVVTNALYSEVTGITTITAANHGLAIDDAVKITGIEFTCPSGPGIVTYPSGAYGYIFNVLNVLDNNTFEVVVGQSTLPHTYNPGSGKVQKYTDYQNQFGQVKDLSIQKDPLTGFNNGITGCANVISAMYSCVGIVTNVVGLGSGAFTNVGIKTTFPGNSGIGFTSVVGITSAVYNEETGKLTFKAPGLTALKDEPVELRYLAFSCNSGGGPSTQLFPSGKYGYDFFIDKINVDGSYEVYVGPSTLPHTYSGGGVVVNRTLGITSAVYDNTTGITTIKAPGLSARPGDLVRIRNLQFSCPSGPQILTYPSGNNGYDFRVVDIVTDKPVAITTAVYDNITGIATVTAPGIKVSYDGLVELRDLKFSCPSGPQILTYPSGKNGYKFRVLTSIGSTFVVNVGTSTLPHTYVSGGTAINRNKTANDTITINVGTSTLPHTYVSGGTLIPPFSRGVGPISQGPYVRNCTNFIPKSIGMKVNGFEAEPGDQDDIGVTGAMSVDSYTQYNQGGIGVSITNGAYTQLVSIFTICDDIAIYTGSGGQCDITNSNSSFGTYGLVSEGVGDETTGSIYRYTGKVKTTANIGKDTVIISGLSTNRPYQGQALYFGKLYYTIDKIDIIDGGSGYTTPPNAIIDAPTGPSGIKAEVNVSIQDGKVISADLINTGSQYEKVPNITFSSGSAKAVVRITPIYYSIDTATLPSAGISTVVLSTNLNNTVGSGTTVYFARTSLQLASSICFEYVGAGNDITKAKPALGGVVIPQNQVVKRNGAQLVYTSTDQSGNFRIGDGVVINQNTGTITGRAFSQSLLNTVTPLIIALSK